jgi:cell division protein FtsX
LDKESLLSSSTTSNTEKAVEVIVHINESLDEERRNGLVEKISEESGVFSVEFTPLRHHLVRVRYNREKVQSMDILNKFKGQSVNAQLVGPI